MNTDETYTIKLSQPLLQIYDRRRKRFAQQQHIEAPATKKFRISNFNLNRRENTLVQSNDKAKKIESAKKRKPNIIHECLGMIAVGMPVGVNHISPSVKHCRHYGYMAHNYYRKKYVITDLDDYKLAFSLRLVASCLSGSTKLMAMYIPNEVLFSEKIYIDIDGWPKFGYRRAFRDWIENAGYKTIVEKINFGLILYVKL